MYPFVRLAKELLAHRNRPLGIFDTHVTHHRIWPQDLDMFVELNNGRVLTLYDLGRMGLFQRIGGNAALRRRRWGATVAGSTVRYRKRLRLLERFEMRSRLLGWDERFLYVDQSMWRGEDCCGQVLIRTAITSRAGIVPTAEAAAEIGHDGGSPALPAWVQGWIAADGQRPWPPERV